MNKIAETELILNPDGSVYHLHLRAEHIGETVIVVGDQDRVAAVSNRFDRVEFKMQNREFITHTGFIGSKKITALSTGIGIDNIDIVLNELDAAVNIDLNARVAKKEHTALNIIRIGTSGALQAEIPVDGFLLSTHGLGFDGLLNFYDIAKTEESEALVDAFIQHTGWNKNLARPYLVAGSPTLMSKLESGMHKGITATAPGFYAPQGRELRLNAAMKNMNEQLTSFNYKGQRITNFEMETSALFGLGAALGHNCATVCAIIGNRVTMQFSKDYRKAIDKLIDTVLERIA
ncbi:MAG: nucleoside phosphorylase [Bacteroidia bacterium]